MLYQIEIFLKNNVESKHDKQFNKFNIKFQYHSVM